MLPNREVQGVCRVYPGSLDALADLIHFTEAPVVLSEHGRCGEKEVRALLKRFAEQIGDTRPSSTVHPGRHSAVLELEALSPVQQREVACATSVLWEEFVADLGGPAGMKDAAGARVAEYVSRLDRCVQQVLMNATPEQSHYALAPKLMVLYVGALGQQHPSPQDQELATAMASLVNCGILIRRAARGSHIEDLGVA